MIKTVVGQEALGLFIFLKKMKPGVLKMLWMERYSRLYLFLLNPEVIFGNGFQLIIFFRLLQALLGRPLRISFALERVRGAPVVVPRLPNA